MRRVILLLSIIFFTTISAFSQEKTIHYLFPEFRNGSVFMKNGTVNNAPMNYNLVTEEMVFNQGGDIFAIADETLKNLDYVIISNRKFVLYEKDKFAEVIHESGYKLYVEHKGRVIPPGKAAGYGGTSQTSAVTTYSSIQSGGMWYELEMPEDYGVSQFKVYLIDNGSGLKKIRSINQLRKLYRKKKDLYDNYIKDNNVEFNNYESVTKLVEYLEDNSK